MENEITGAWVRTVPSICKEAFKGFQAAGFNRSEAFDLTQQTYASLLENTLNQKQEVTDETIAEAPEAQTPTETSTGEVGD